MTTIAIIIGGAIANALAFSGSNFLFSTMSKNQSRKNERDMIKLSKISSELK